MKRDQPDNFNQEHAQKKGFRSFSPFPSPKQEEKGHEVNTPQDSPMDSQHQVIFVREGTERKLSEKIPESPRKALGLKNPFAKFYNDSNSKQLISSPQSAKKEANKNLSCSSPMKYDSNGSQNEVKCWLEENYLKLNHDLMKKPVQSSELFFFRQEETSYLSVSKLLWFKPNRKNGRHLIYDSESHKCIPIYRCEGCLKNFEVASALGGHLSSCDFKKLHSKYLKETKFIKKVEPMEFTSFDFITDQKQKLRSNTKHSDPEHQGQKKLSENDLFFQSKSESDKLKKKRIGKRPKKDSFRIVKKKKTMGFPLKVIKHRKMQMRK